MNSQPTYKEALTIATAATISVKNNQINLTSNSLIIVTAAGTITGTYVSENIEDSLNDDATYTVFKTIDTNARKLCNSASHSILLKDATMITSSGTHNIFKYLYVFVEEIIAVSFGEMTQN